jgi:hypothetical protein
MADVRLVSSPDKGWQRFRDQVPAVISTWPVRRSDCAFGRRQACLVGMKRRIDLKADDLVKRLCMGG